MSGAVIEVVRPGPLATVQDLGRPGYAHLGVPPSGAADPVSLRLANRLVGNPAGAAGLELTLGGAQLEFSAPAWVALTGAPLAASAQAHPVGMNAPTRVRGLLDLGNPVAGVRTYLAVRGGLEVDRVLGSASSDLLSGLGPPVLAEGTTLAVGATGALAVPSVDAAPERPLPREPVLRLRPGPRDDWLAGDGVGALCRSTYTVTQHSDRVGVRLDGPALTRREGELPSEGVVTGAVQVPTSGQPIVFLTDHPTTGGYPVVAVLAVTDLAVAAQLRPDAAVRFRLLSGT